MVGDVTFDFSKVEHFLMIRQFLVQGAGLDVVKGNSPEGILRMRMLHRYGESLPILINHE